MHPKFIFKLDINNHKIALNKKSEGPFQLVFKPGLHISRKDRQHTLENMFFKLSSYGLVSMW